MPRIALCGTFSHHRDIVSLPADQPAPITHLRRNAALALMALLALFGLYHLAIQPTLSNLATGVPFINSYGRQRMLSQRLTKSLLATQQAVAQEDQARYRQELRETLDEWSMQHAHLIRHDFGYLRNPRLDVALRELDACFRTMREATLTFLESPTVSSAESHQLAASILREEPRFLARMNDIVGMYEMEVGRRVGELRTGGWIIFTLLIITAGFLYFCVIAPAIQALSALYTGNLARYRTLVENMTDGLALVDRIGTIQFANPRLLQMLHREESDFCGSRLDDFLILGPGARTSLLNTIVQQGAVESNFARSDDSSPVETIVRSRRILATDSTAETFLLVFTDVTREKAERRRIRVLQDQLMHVNRLKTVGEMSASLTHELGQPLGAISAFVGGCQYQLQSGAYSPLQIQEHLQRIDLAATRAAEILKRFRSYGRRADFATASINLPLLVAEVRELCTPILTEGRADFVVDLADSLPPIYADPLLLQQVLINLIQNAIQSLGELPWFRRTIRLTIGSEESSLLNIAVTDQGCGISPMVLTRLQEPFFTTRTTGLGLGLAICRTIIEDHEGHLCLTSEEGVGTTVRITLPSVAGEVRHA